MKEKSNIVSPVLYLQHHYELLKAEYEYEKEQFRQQTEVMGIGRKVKRGMCWYPISVGRSYYNALNQFVVGIFRTEDKEIEHLFEYGRPVCFFTQDAGGRLTYLNFVATVNYVDEDRMVVILPGPDAMIALQRYDVLGVQLYFDETSYRLMFEALNRVIGAKNNRLAELRDIFHGQQPVSEFSFNPIRFPWLNRTQEEAVNKVLHAKDVAIVHGPPGTGKTTTLVEAIYETLHRENQVMVCAQSNMAVDWISEKLIDRGVSVLRIGNPSRVNDKMLSFTYERKFESHPDYSQLWSIRKAIRELYSANRKGADRESIRLKINSLKDRATELEIRINESLFAEARVISCTLVSSANRVLMGHKFGTLFIDEAAQALEAACWIPIAKADRVIFAGDHCQLPPTVKSPVALRGGLGHTLMQSIVANKPQAVSLLKVQYRMNRINKQEAELSVGKLKEYIEKIGRERFLDERIDVGVISPYKAQVQYLRQLIRKDAWFKPYRQYITVNTVDGFQGQERDVILISLVRANEEGQIGFLNDLRRMNVAITRARMKLIILGDVATLTKHPFYKKLNEYIESLF